MPTDYRKAPTYKCAECKLTPGHHGVEFNRSPRFGSINPVVAHPFIIGFTGKQTDAPV